MDRYADNPMVPAHVLSLCQQYLDISKLLCEFHTKKAVNENLMGKVRSDDDRHQIYAAVLQLMRAKSFSEEAFLKPAMRFCAEWIHKWPKFVLYFIKVGNMALSAKCNMNAEICK